MSTMSRLEEVMRQKEEILHRSIIDRLCAWGRILPGERLCEIVVTGSSIASHPHYHNIVSRETFTFPDYARRTA